MPQETLQEMEMEMEMTISGYNILLWLEMEITIVSKFEKQIVIVFEL